MARVLLVEPDVDLRTLQSIAISRAGHTVTSAASYEAARQALARERADVLITAVRLGAYNGLHLIIRARAEHPGLLAILTAAVPDPSLETEARAHGALFLSDASDMEGLLSLLGAVSA